MIPKFQIPKKKKKKKKKRKKKKNISSHQDIWIIFTYLFGQSDDCILMPK